MSRRSVRTLATCFAMVASSSIALAQYESGQAAGATAESSLKRALKEGRVVVGTTISVPNVDTALAAATSGFDFLWMEMEHSSISLQSLREMLLATKGTSAVPITRVPVNQPWLAKQVLDMGSLGVVFPFTTTRELAQQAVASCKYPPAGIRGFGPSLAVSRYGMSASDYVKFADDNVVVVVIIEEKKAVENIDAIASVPGIDVLFIGANDLSYSLGVRGKIGDPIVEEAVAKILAAGKKYGVPVGYVAANPAEINKRISQGFRFFQASSDLNLLRNGARELLSKVERPAARDSSPRQ